MSEGSLPGAAAAMTDPRSWHPAGCGLARSLPEDRSTMPSRPRRGRRRKLERRHRIRHRPPRRHRSPRATVGLRFRKRRRRPSGSRTASYRWSAGATTTDPPPRARVSKPPREGPSNEAIEDPVRRRRIPRKNHPTPVTEPHPQRRRNRRCSISWDRTGLRTTADARKSGSKPVRIAIEPVRTSRARTREIHSKIQKPIDSRWIRHSYPNSLALARSKLSVRNDSRSRRGTGFLLSLSEQ
mmetsp:Transcript_158/g.413  ORF Transcript_158/g.413 Transcript_158/m.413 type:complete len:240 (-) Transcript_158:1187-1906(-)